MKSITQITTITGMMLSGIANSKTTNSCKLDMMLMYIAGVNYTSTALITAKTWMVGGRDYKNQIVLKDGKSAVH